MNGVELGLIKPLDAETRIEKVKDEIAIQSKEGEVDRALLEAYWCSRFVRFIRDSGIPNCTKSILKIIG